MKKTLITTLIMLSTILSGVIGIIPSKPTIASATIVKRSKGSVEIDKIANVWQEESPTSAELDQLSRKKIGFGIKHEKNGVIPNAGSEINNIFKKFDGYYLGDTSAQGLYLTFDNGYENGYTEKILDVLKSNDVKAAFFVTTPYIKENPDLIKRMHEEGHIVGNHTTKHPSMPSVTSFEQFKFELDTCSEAYKSVTGTEMPKYFRPPMGEFSELSMAYTKNLGFKSIFWSFGYKDWDPKNQMSEETAKQKINNALHNGEIFLLHSVSKTNTDILDSVIKDLKGKGYSFLSLDQLQG